MTLLSTVLAQTDFTLAPDSNYTGLTTLTLGDFISWAITAILVLAALAFFFMLLIGGVKWIISGGDKANTESARNQVTAAIIGLVIVFSAWVILNFVLGLFGIEAGNFDFGTISGSGGSGQ